MQSTSDPLITISAASQAVGVNISTLWRQVKSGQVRNHDGKVRLSEVIADRKANLSPTNNRRKTTRRAEAEKAQKAQKKRPGRKPSVKAEVAPDAQEPPTLFDSFTAAQARERNSIAALRDLELQQKRGNLIDRTVAEREFYEAGKAEREAWTTWPARVAATMAARLGVSASDLLREMSDSVREHLDERARGLGYSRGSEAA